MRARRWPNGLGWDVRGDSWEAEVWDSLPGGERGVRVDRDGVPWRCARVSRALSPVEAVRAVLEDPSAVTEEWEEHVAAVAQRGQSRQSGTRVDWEEVLGGPEELAAFRRSLGLA